MALNKWGSHHRPEVRPGRVLGLGQDGAQTQVMSDFTGTDSEFEGFVDPRSQRKPKGGFPGEAKHVKGSWN